MDKKDLEQLANLIDTKFSEFEVRIDEKLDKRFAEFSLEIAEIFHDFAFTIDRKFVKFENKFDKRFEEQNKKLSLLDKKFDFLTNSYQENLEQHKQYDSNLSRINSNLFDHDMRIDSLEARSITATI